MKRLLERTFEQYGILPSITFAGEQPIVYLQLKQQIQEVATSLQARGIKKGDRMAIMGENCPNCWSRPIWAMMSWTANSSATSWTTARRPG